MPRSCWRSNKRSYVATCSLGVKVERPSQEITQEVRVALIDRENGHELSKYIRRCRESQVAAKEVPGIQPSEGGFDGDCG